MQAPTRRTIGSCLGMIVFIVVLYTLPLLALVIGWAGWDWQTGAQAALIALITLVSLAAGMLILLRQPTILEASFPVIFGALYAILPDLVILGVDDGLVFSMGSLLSFLLWRKRRRDIPISLLLPILAASAYTFVGGFIPGPFDEMVVYAITGGLAWWMWNKSRPKWVTTGSAESGAALPEASQPLQLQPAWPRLDLPQSLSEEADLISTNIPSPDLSSSAEEPALAGFPTEALPSPIAPGTPPETSVQATANQDEEAQ